MANPRPGHAVWWLAVGRAKPKAPSAHKPTSLDTRMMDQALALARRAAREGEVPVGAVVYRTATGEVLATGFNRRERDRDPASHAEFTAILEACKAVGDWRLNDCTLAVTLEPCPMCAGLIVNARLGRVVYACDDPRAGAVRSLFAVTSDPRLNHRPQIVPAVRAQRASALLRDFFAALRRRNKLKARPARRSPS